MLFLGKYKCNDFDLDFNLTGKLRHHFDLGMEGLKRVHFPQWSVTFFIFVCTWMIVWPFIRYSAGSSFQKLFNPLYVNGPQESL